VVGVTVFDIDTGDGACRQGESYAGYSVALVGIINTDDTTIVEGPEIDPVWRIGINGDSRDIDSSRLDGHQLRNAGQHPPAVEAAPFRIGLGVHNFSLAVIIGGTNETAIEADGIGEGLSAIRAQRIVAILGGDHLDIGVELIDMAEHAITAPYGASRAEALRR